MKKIIIILSLFVSIVSLVNAELKVFKLRNGLSVYLWPDENQPDVSGSIVVRAGSIDEPKEFTGLAHYLEHLLFKGTQKIGSIDWEKEKVLYNEIIALYDELVVTTNIVERDTLTKKINRKSIEAAQYALTSDFSNLIEGMGGRGLNAGTSFDYTSYFNNFPAFQVEKWLDVYSERFVNPVFRAFQAELENVFEEYNMYQDDRNTHVSQFLFSNVYPTHPYGRQIIGDFTHIKNPSLTKLIEFYETWYVPSNMALILVGNFDVNNVLPLINRKFGRLIDKKLPERKIYPKADFSSNPRFSAKLAYTPQLFFAYQGIHKGHEDELPLSVCTRLLSNNIQTGLLDKLTLDGDVGFATVLNDMRRDDGRILIVASPYFDINQRIYESDRATERLLMNEVDKIKNGEIEDWRLKSVIDDMLMANVLVYETPNSKMNVLTNLFVYNQSPTEFFEYAERLESLTKEQIQSVARKYFAGGKITVSIEEGKPKKNKISKPNILPIEQPKGVQTAYSKYIQSLPVVSMPEIYNKFDDVKKVDLSDGQLLYYTENTQNNIFSLTIKYGIGRTEMQKLRLAVPLMNSAGIMPNLDAQQLRRKFSELNVRSNFDVDDDYFYVSMFGDEGNLTEACKLITKQILMPKLDDKQLQRVKGSEISFRMFGEKSDIETLSNAAVEYVLFNSKSSYIDRLSLSEVYYANLSELTGEIIRATDYEAEFHYVGSLSLEKVVEVLKNNMPFKAQVKDSNSPTLRDRVDYSGSSIYLLENSDVQQAKVYFYVNGSEYNIDNAVASNAFYQYFSGGFNGLVMGEIRENNSMAYQAYGAMINPPIPFKKSYFLGYVGTQPDKVAGAIDIYMDLLKEMPLYPERIDNIKTYLKLSALSNKPSFRNKSQTFRDWQKLGYDVDPAEKNIPLIDKLSFKQIVEFYETEIKGKPVTIVIVGNPKDMDLKEIQKSHGKIIKLRENNIFSKVEM